MKNAVLGPRAFLKKLGFRFDKSAAALDREFLRQFAPDARQNVEMIWLSIQDGLVSATELYKLPQNDAQAGALFSHDAARSVASLASFAGIVERLAPASVAELGCGAGYLLRYLRHLHPDLRLTGIDRSDNLLKLIPEESGIHTVCGDYAQMSAASPHDLVLCDFGWDNSDMPLSRSPHGDAEIGGQSYCPGCSDDAVPFFEMLVGGCSAWAGSGGHIALAGRLPNIGQIRALVLAAGKRGWVVPPGGFDLLKVRSAGAGTEKFPSLVFCREQAASKPMDLADMAAIYGGTTAIS